MASEFPEHAPTTEDVKQRWLEAHRVPASLGREKIGHLRQQRLAEFDLWLEQTMSQVWQECSNKAYDLGYLNEAQLLTLHEKDPRSTR